MKNYSNDWPCNCLSLLYNYEHRQGNKAAPLTREQQDMSNKAQKQQDKSEAIENLRQWLIVGDTIYTVLRHVSASGMTRYIDLYVIRDGRPLRLTWSVAQALGWPYDKKRESLKVTGCGMDMGFHTVYSLAYVLNKGKTDGDAGYSLQHNWL